MTNKEAISIIKSIKEEHIPRKTVQDDALDLAIKALEERPTGEWEEERTCEWENDEEGRNHEQRY